MSDVIHELDDEEVRAVDPLNVTFRWIRCMVQSCRYSTGDPAFFVKHRCGHDR